MFKIGQLVRIARVRYKLSHKTTLDYPPAHQNQFDGWEENWLPIGSSEIGLIVEHNETNGDWTVLFGDKAVLIPDTNWGTYLEPYG